MAKKRAEHQSKYFPQIAVGAMVVFASFLATAQDNLPATRPAQAVLRIEVIDVRAAKGQLIFGVFRSADGFPTDPKKAVNWQIKAASGKSVVFECQLPPGRYGASVLHDENGNGKMDKNAIGIPLEGYGETNNPKPRLRAATFDESLFTLPPEGASLKISIQYF